MSQLLKKKKHFDAHLKITYSWPFQSKFFTISSSVSCNIFNTIFRSLNLKNIVSNVFPLTRQKFSQTKKLLKPSFGCFFHEFNLTMCRQTMVGQIHNQIHLQITGILYSKESDYFSKKVIKNVIYIKISISCI